MKIGITVFLFIFSCILNTKAEIQTAGVLLVNLDARHPSAGTEEWINSGTLSNFTRYGQPVLKNIDGCKAVSFNGKNDACIGPPAIESIMGNCSRSIEVWAYNPNLQEEETMVAWGRRGERGRNMSFNFGSSREFGAATHWVSDMGWHSLPRAGEWHYLVYTYDGATVRVYHNTRGKNLRKISLDTASGPAINLAVQNGRDGEPQFNNEFTGASQAGSLSLAIVRIHDDVLTPVQITENFNEESLRFGAVIPADPLAEKKIVLTGEQCRVSLLPYYHTAASLSPVTMMFDFTPGDRLEQRIDQGYYHLGDCSLMWRYPTGSWHSFSSALARDTTCKEKVTDDTVMMNLTPLLGEGCPLTLGREWTVEKGRIVLRFFLKNKGTTAVELGAFGAAMVFNNLLTGRHLDESHQKCVFVEPYEGGDAGYLQVTRLNGQGPVLLVVPEQGTSFENYRPLRDDPTRKGVTFEGFYEWMTCSKALEQTDWHDVPQWNKPTSHYMQPGDALRFGFVFALADTLRDVTKTLVDLHHPVAVSFPGYVLPMGEYASLFVRNPGKITDISDEPAGRLKIQSGGYSNDKEWKRYFLVPRKAGRCRIVITYTNAVRQYVHYTIIPSQYDQVRRMARFHESNQWYDDSSDPYGRTYSYMSYDNEAGEKVLREQRSYISGLSDEPGAGPNLAMAIKNLMAPDPAQVKHLEQYVNNALWGRLQYTNNYGIRASLFYGTGWNKRRTETTWRAYNYPHQAAIYWCLYRLARNYDGLVTSRSWEWYLRQAYKTGLALKEHCGRDDFLFLSQYGLMVGSAFPEILKDLQREKWSDEAETFESFMKSRAAIWKSLEYPFGSEMPWDSTGQEEVYLWCDYFGYTNKAQVTLNAILGYMPAIPHWAYNGNARRYFDSMVYGKWRIIARESHHYGSSLNAIPVLHAYRNSPDDIHLLQVGYAGAMGVLANISSNGFGSMCFISDPERMACEPYSSDFGCAFYGYSYNAGCYVIEDPVFDLLCFGGTAVRKANIIRIVPADAYRRRIYLAPYNLWLTLESGCFREIILLLESKTIQIGLEPANDWTSAARLVVEQPGKSTVRIKPVKQFRQERGAWVIPLNTGITRFELK